MLQSRLIFPYSHPQKGRAMLNAFLPFVLILVFVSVLLFWKFTNAAHAAKLADEAARAAADFINKQDLLRTLAPLLDALHQTYSRYTAVPDFASSAWYSLRKTYIETMADF